MPAYRPFLLPRLPLSIVSQMLSLGELFHAEWGACLAAVFVLDRLARIWLPILPTQQCGRTGVQYRLRSSDYADLPPHLLIAGSFQTIASASLFRSADAVPKWDGVHLVSGISQPASFVFVRCEAETHLADPASVFSDDLQTMLRRYSDRLRVRAKHGD